MKQYTFKGLAGCVVQRVSRKTKTLVGLYHSEQAGMESDPDLPWTTTCEKHSTLVCHETLALARSSVPDPTLWCDDCRQDEDEKDITQYICTSPCHCLPTRREGREECACRHNGAESCSNCGSAMHKIYIDTGKRVPRQENA